MLSRSAVDHALDAGLLADLAQGGRLVRLAGLDPALGQGPTRAAGRADQAQLEHGSPGRVDDAACRHLVPDLHAFPLEARRAADAGRSPPASISLGACAGSRSHEATEVFGCSQRSAGSRTGFAGPSSRVWLVGLRARPGGRPPAPPRAQRRRLLQSRRARPAGARPHAAPPAHGPRQHRRSSSPAPRSTRASPRFQAAGARARRHHAGHRAGPAEACRPTARPATRG